MNDLILEKLQERYGISILGSEANMHAFARDCAALAAQPGAEPAKNNDVDQLLRAVFELCEATEEAPEVAPKNEHQRGFERGRRFEAKAIRRAVGDWFQATFCGRSFMGEPVIAAAPTEAKPAQDAVDAEQTIPGGDWLWCKLMDWCKKRGTSPASYNDLFAIVGEARAAISAKKGQP